MSLDPQSTGALDQIEAPYLLWVGRWQKQGRIQIIMLKLLTAEGGLKVTASNLLSKAV